MEIAENIDIIGYEWLGEEDGSVMMAAEDSWRGLAVELNELHFVKGAAFVEQLRNIVYWGGFRLVEGETNIFSALGEQSEDFDNLLNAARKAVEHGYRVYILPNPKGIRTADFIFEQKSNYKLYDLKTITGKASVETRLLESIGQTNRVLLNMAVNRFKTQNLIDCSVRNMKNKSHPLRWLLIGAVSIKPYSPHSAA